MPAPLLRDDALTAGTDGFELRLSLPWIRSMALACVRDLSIVIDGSPRDVDVVLGTRQIPPAELADEDGWWFLQDRLVLRGSDPLGAGPHRVAAGFRLTVPYLTGGPDGPLVLPFRAELGIDPRAPRTSAARDVGDGGAAGSASPPAEGPPARPRMHDVSGQLAGGDDGPTSDANGRGGASEIAGVAGADGHGSASGQSASDANGGPSAFGDAEERGGSSTAGANGGRTGVGDAGAVSGWSNARAAADDGGPATPLPGGWRLTANAFNWTQEVVRADRPAHDLVAGIVSGGVASEIEVEAGQVWRGFPSPSSDDVARLRDGLAAAGGSVSIVGASIDDWAGADLRRDDERLAFFLPQLRAAALLGAVGVRLPLGQAGRPLLERLIPHLHELDLTLFEEVQGQQPLSGAAFDDIADLDDPRLRVLVDTSMLMPALPVTFLERMSALPADLHARLRDEWFDPATHGAVMAALRNGSVPPELHASFMNLIVRFGRSAAAELRPILPLTGAIHLKFWDLADADGRVSAPLRELGGELRRSGFAGSLCSEWGGHEWLDADATEMTRDHIALARRTLAEGAMD